MRWSKLKQRVEDRMAPSLQRRVEVHSTRYHNDCWQEDSRLGKRRLRTLYLGDDEHPLVRQFYDLRCEAEGIKGQITGAYLRTGGLIHLGACHL